VTRFFKIKGEELKKKRTGYRDFLAVGMELRYRHSGIGQTEIARRFGDLDYGAVSRESKRLRERMAADGRLMRALEEIENNVNQR
jgi:hypothetical protein